MYISRHSIHVLYRRPTTPMVPNPAAPHPACPWALPMSPNLCQRPAAQSMQVAPLHWTISYQQANSERLHDSWTSFPLAITAAVTAKVAGFAV